MRKLSVISLGILLIATRQVHAMWACTLTLPEAEILIKRYPSVQEWLLDPESATQSKDVEFPKTIQTVAATVDSLIETLSESCKSTLHQFSAMQSPHLAPLFDPSVCDEALESLENVHCEGKLQNDSKKEVVHEEKNIHIQIEE